MFKGLQVVAAGALSFGHGANDAQKTMGVVAALLLGAGYTTAGKGGAITVPEWVALAAYGQSRWAPSGAVGRSSRRWV